MEETNSELDFGEKPKHILGWVDFTIAAGGILVLYGLLIFITSLVAGIWPHQRALLYINGFLTQISLGLLILILKKARGWTRTDLGWRLVNWRQIWASILGLYALTWFINMIYAIMLYNRGFTPPSTDIYTKLLGHTTWITFILNIILASIFAPVIEETLFRGIIFKSLRKYFGKWTAAVISAAMFSGLHMQTYGFIPRFVLGLALAYLYERNNSLYPSMALHSLNNFIVTVMMAGLST